MICLGTNENPEAAKLAELALGAQDELSRLRLNHLEMDELLREAMRLGSMGGKLSGAGCGGAFYFICRDETSAREIQKELTAHSRQKKITLSARLKIKLIQGI